MGLLDKALQRSMNLTTEQETSRSSEQTDIQRRISLSPTADRLVDVLRVFAENDPQGILGDKIDTLEFMLKGVLAGREEEEVRDSIQEIYNILGSVLYPAAEAALAQAVEDERITTIVIPDDVVVSPIDDLPEALSDLLGALPNDPQRAAAVHSED